MSSAIFSASFLHTGNSYKVYAKYAAHQNRASNTLVHVSTQYENVSIQLDQRTSPQEWNLIGEYLLSQDSSILVSNENTDGYVVVDAFKFECATMSQTDAASCVGDNGYASFSKPYDSSASIVDVLNVLSVVNGMNNDYNMQQRIDKCLDLDGDGLDSDEIQSLVNSISGVSSPVVSANSESDSISSCPSCMAFGDISYTRCVCS